MPALTENRIDPASREGLKNLGREVIDWEAWTSLSGAVCVVAFDHNTGTIHGGADPRRQSYAAGW